MLVIVNIIIKIFKLFVFKSLEYGFEENMFIKFYNFFVEGILVSFINKCKVCKGIYICIYFFLVI